MPATLTFSKLAIRSVYHSVSH